MQDQKGVTLVELMIVVAIIGILASIGSIAYGKYIRSGKISALEQIAMQVGAGQERYRARNNGYYPIAGGAVPYLGNEQLYQNLLDFNQQIVGDITITTEAWDGTGPICNICGPVFTPNTAIAGYAVVVTRDLDTGIATDTTVLFGSQTTNPILTNEGH